MKKRTAIQHELKLLGASKSITSKSEVIRLSDILHHEENILAFIYGMYEGGVFALMVATNKRIVFVSRVPGSLLVDDIPYDMVASIEYNIGVFRGKVKLFARHKNYDFSFVNKKQVMPFAHVVEDLILKRQIK